ncbi:MAG: hypothetical protein ROO76_10970 [Terriglobia bacterium]|jgi:hypothetical protein|nr:hypothetical protein [Terriglobia bacterium]
MSVDWNDSSRAQAPRRAAAAMLRALGGSEIVLRVSAPMGTVDTRGLGLQQYDISEIRLSPAIVREVKGAPTPRWEALLPAAEVEAKLGTGREAIAAALHQNAEIVWNAKTLRIRDVSTELFANCEYLYRITLGE